MRMIRIIAFPVLAAALVLAAGIALNDQSEALRARAIFAWQF